MGKALKTVTYLLSAFTVLAGLVAGDIAAFAQSASCSQLNNSLSSLNRNSDFRSLQQNALAARSLAEQIQTAESQFVRGGCQKTLNSGKTLSRDCRAVARVIVNGRKDYSRLAARIETGKAVAQQREVTLQQFARFGCHADPTSNARINPDEMFSERSPFEQLLNRIFGGEGQIRDGAFDYFNQSTLRTVCVRACDGYYWPVSFSTVSEYLQEDSANCQAQAGNAEVDLYYYSNPGEDPESMVNLQGVPYKSHPNAFAYRREFNPQCTTKKTINFGTIQLSAEIEGKTSRAEITFGDVNFPLPLRDPRRSSNIVVTQALYVPLPRPRPVRDGEVSNGTTATRPSGLSTGQKDQRVIVSGKRTVRIVGPDTPYVQAAATGS